MYGVRRVRAPALPSDSGLAESDVYTGQESVRATVNLCLHTKKEAAAAAEVAYLPDGRQVTSCPLSG